jgi:GTP diphosphokinase / guanosine-3',5'-bis(diphosphate) 3'-diphosphatase
MSYDELLAKVKEYLTPEKVALVENAYQYARKAHEGEFRLSGEPYVEHPITVATILADLRLDAYALSAALLHDVCENHGVPIADIEKEFGADVARLVDGVTKLSKLTKTGERMTDETQLQNLRKMLVAMAEDLRVVFIKLADRLHNMRTLDALPEEKQRSIARETAEIYAPLAHRLGIWEMKWQLEDLSFRYLEPERYHEVAKMLTARRVQREKFITEFIDTLKQEFAKQGIKAEISGRPKHLFSINQKMQKYAKQGKRFDDIHDLLALRVLVNSVQDCYTAIGAIHSFWRPIPGSFDDYIANPKPNGYQSLHTAIIYQEATPLEVQVRTYEMHHFAEYGVAAHWNYKESATTSEAHFEKKIGWLRQLVDWHRELSQAEDFLESVKTDILIDQVFVFTPKGEIKDLPKGSTSLDLAYRIHTEVGHHCVGAKINSRLVPLTTQLNNGDVVDVMTSKNSKGPSRDWLSPYLGYIKSSQARVKIRQWFRKLERAENIDRGREALEKELRRLGIRFQERAELATKFKYDNLDDFLLAIGNGDITSRQIALKLAVDQEEKEKQEAPVTTAPATLAKTPSTQVNVLGVGDMLTHLAPCCHPVPGDDIIGYITRSRGVTVHRTDCYNIINEDEPERLIPVDWGSSDTLYPVMVRVDAWDRVGLIRDITTTVADEKINIIAINLDNQEQDTITVTLTLETKGISHLARLMTLLDNVRGVTGVSRLGKQPNIKKATGEKAGKALKNTNPRKD